MSLVTLSSSLLIPIYCVVEVFVVSYLHRITKYKFQFNSRTQTSQKNQNKKKETQKDLLFFFVLFFWLLLFKMFLLVG